MSDKNKKPLLNNIKASFSGRKLRSGAYVTAMSVVVIVIVLVVNMLFTKMNFQVDLSTEGMYSLSDDSKKLVKDLKDDITIYYLAQNGTEKDLFTNIVKQYDSASDKVKLEYKDPVLYPKFVEQHGIDDQVTNSSFLVVNNKNKRAKYIDYNDLLVMETNPQTYEQTPTALDVEGEITAAIQNVTTTDPTKMYVVEGHGETATGNSFNELVKKMNVTTESLQTASKEIPKDCDMLFINAPTSDFSDSETKMVKDYLINGGKAVITVDFNSEKLKNFLSILDYYGVDTVNGVVMEGDDNMHISGYNNYLLPTINSDDITKNVREKDVPVFMPNATGLKDSEQKRKTITIKPLLSTSDSAYSKVDMTSKTIEKEDGDINGPFNVGVVATDEFNGVTSGIVVLGSSYAFGDETSEYANASLLSGTIGYCVGNKDLLSIPTKSLSSPSLQLSQNQAIVIGSTVVIIIPIIILVAGGFVYYRRRRR